MKKHLLISMILVVMLALSSFAAAKLTADTNLASKKKAYGTFTYAPFATDGKTKGVMAISGNIDDTPQYLTIDLGTNMYLKNVKIYWDKNALSENFSIKTSSDAKYWNEEAKNLNASFGAIDNASGTIAVNVSLQRSVEFSRYIQIKIPAGTQVKNPKGDYVKIAEIEVFPELDQDFTIKKSHSYVVTGTSCIIKYDTSLGAAGGKVVYGETPEELVKIAGNAESGISNSVPIGNLEPNKTYFYQVRTTDHYGNTIFSKVNNFTTQNKNLALNKKVDGTFTFLPPNEKYAKDGSEEEILSRINDGKTSYFTSMATSGSIPNSDQYVIIDLGKKHNIKNIVSYWRRLAYPESLKIQVSNNNKDWQTIETNINAAKGAFARSDAGDPMRVVSTRGGAGRYVKLLVEKGSAFYHKHNNWNFVQLMEVEVFAE